ncbi:MAG TPA: alpha/beta hydrolase [Burkholderiales bacterium]|nr:alpha/beta hydrolase [Burkholderiales bacterium]
MRITKHFVTVGKRRVHYLRAGRGPALAMLHACPVSAKVMRPLMPVFGEKFTCLAFDMPGFGLSDRLAQPRPSIEDFADALAETLDALGIEQVATYGRHTGASIAVEFAARHPSRTSMALADGYAVFAKRYTDEELDAYLEPIVPVWDGGHLLRLWMRYRDQHVFWPWNRQSAAARSDADIPDVDFLHRGVVEMLEAGNDYRIGYAAPFRHRALDVLAELKVPVCFGNRPGDSMWLTRPLYPASAWQEAIPRELDPATLREREILLKHPPRGEPPPAPSCTPLPGRSTTDYVDGIFFRYSGTLEDVRYLVLHHAPGSSFLYDDLVMELGNALAVDLPGHGESDPGGSVFGLLKKLNIKPSVLYGHNGGGAVAVDLADQLGKRAARVVLDAPCILRQEERRLVEEYAPPVTPVWDGSHWLRAWHHMRDSELWWPWFERTHQNARHTARIDPQELTIRVREAMKQPASYEPAWQACLSYDWRERVAALPNVLTIAAPEDVFAHLVPARPVKDNAASRARAIKEWVQ